jgi:hypothetical protein
MNTKSASSWFYYTDYWLHIFTSHTLFYSIFTCLHTHKSLILPNIHFLTLILLSRLPMELILQHFQIHWSLYLETVQVSDLTPAWSLNFYFSLYAWKWLVQTETCGLLYLTVCNGSDYWKKKYVCKYTQFIYRIFSNLIRTQFLAIS